MTTRPIRTRRTLACLALAGLLSSALAACSGSSPESATDSGAPTPTTTAAVQTSTGSATPTAATPTTAPPTSPTTTKPTTTNASTSSGPTTPRRTRTLSRPKTTAIKCSCPSQVLGESTQGRVAVALDLPTSYERDTDPRIVTVTPSGKIAWKKPIRVSAVGAVPHAPSLATKSAVVTSVDGGLAGLSWKDGSRTWFRNGEGRRPEAVPGYDDLFTLTTKTYDGSRQWWSYVGVFDAATGKAKWSTDHLDDYTIDEAAGALVGVNFSDSGAVLTHVDLDTFKASTVKIPTWKGPGTTVTATDNTVTVYLGSHDHTKAHTATVRHWASAKPRVKQSSGPVDSPRLPKGTTKVDSSDDGALTLAVKTNKKHRPTVAMMVNEHGKVLWKKPAAKVISWNASKGSPDTSLFEISAPLKDGTRLAIVDRALSFYPYHHGAVQQKTKAAYTVLDAKTGEKLWSWGDRSRVTTLQLLPDLGVAYGTEAGAGSVKKPKPRRLRVATLDLRTGKPDWSVTGRKTDYAFINPVDTAVLVSLPSGTWLISSAKPR